MLHHVKIAMGGTRVLKYRCFGGKFTPVGGTRVSRTSFGGTFRPIYGHTVHACVQPVGGTYCISNYRIMYCIQHICRKYAISRVGRL